MTRARILALVLLACLGAALFPASPALAVDCATKCSDAKTSCDSECTKRKTQCTVRCGVPGLPGYDACRKTCDDDIGRCSLQCQAALKVCQVQCKAVP